MGMKTEAIEIIGSVTLGVAAYEGIKLIKQLSRVSEEKGPLPVEEKIIFDSENQLSGENGGFPQIEFSY